MLVVLCQRIIDRNRQQGDLSAVCCSWSSLDYDGRGRGRGRGRQKAELGNVHLLLWRRPPRSALLISGSDWLYALVKAVYAHSRGNRLARQLVYDDRTLVTLFLPILLLWSNMQNSYQQQQQHQTFASLPITSSRLLLDSGYRLCRSAKDEGDTR